MRDPNNILPYGICDYCKEETNLLDLLLIRKYDSCLDCRAEALKKEKEKTCCI